MKSNNIWSVGILASIILAFGGYETMAGWCLALTFFMTAMNE